MCKAFIRGCVHQKSGTVIQDRPIESRAKQSLPDMLTLKPSSVVNGELGKTICDPASQNHHTVARYGFLVKARF